MIPKGLATHDVWAVVDLPDGLGWVRISETELACDRGDAPVPDFDRRGARRDHVKIAISCSKPWAP